MTKTTVTAHVDLSGPLFQRDPGKTLRGNIRKMMAGVAAEGERIVRENLRAGQAGRAPISALGDRVADHAIGRVTSLTGKHWMATAVVSVNNSGFSPKQGISLMAAASSVEGRSHAFRALYRDLQRSRAVARANLTEGLE